MIIHYWTPELLASIPDDVLYAEAARRRGRKRQSYTGGTVWAQHNPNTNRCRCEACSDARSFKRATGATSVTIREEQREADGTLRVISEVTK